MQAKFLTFCGGTLVCLGLLTSPSVGWAYHYEVVNGATCTSINPNDGFPEFNWFLGFRFDAFCQLTMTVENPVTNLAYVYVAGTEDRPDLGLMSLRLCVHDGSGSSFGMACGEQTNMSGGFVLLVPPSPLPPNASGAFVQAFFPGQGEEMSEIDELIPVWN